MTAAGWLIIAVGLAGYLLFIWRMIGAGNADDAPFCAEAGEVEAIELFPEPVPRPPTVSAPEGAEEANAGPGHPMAGQAWADRLDQMLEDWIGDLPDDWEELNDLGLETDRLLDRARRVLAFL